MRRAGRTAKPRKRRLFVAAMLFVTPFAAGRLAMDPLTGLFFFPTAEIEETPASARLAFDEVSIPRSDGPPLHGWWLRSSIPDGPRGIVVQAHGNGANVSRHWRLAAGLVARGFDVLAFDYRGYGRSSGKPTRRRAVEDLHAALDFAAARSADAGGLPLALLGQSMGAALALEVAPQRDDLAALVLDSPFSSWPDVAALHLAAGRWYRPVLRGLLEAVFIGAADPVDHAARLGAVPVLVVTGTADEVCPSVMARAVHAAAPEGAELLVLPESPHVGRRGELVRDRVDAAMAAFLEGAVDGIGVGIGVGDEDGGGAGKDP